MSGARPDDLEPEDDPLIGRVIAGKFVIERLLGAGAMGAVYRAQQTALERAVAIKVMHGGFAADATYAARFRLEAKAASRLDHPNLIRVLDSGQEADGLLYIAMEYLDCRDLFQVLEADWPLTHERIVDLLSQTLSGLAEAHEAGVFHRDLKPENVFVVRRKGDEGGSVELVKVGDFGIAKVVEPAGDGDAAMRGQGRKLTTAGLVVGTPEYMSPEQARGESFDARSDLYAIGVILYQLLTHRLPFPGKTSIEVVWKAMQEEPARLDADGPTAAPGLDAVCEKAIRKRPEDRFQSAREMRAALRAAPKVATSRAVGADAAPLGRLSQTPTHGEFTHASVVGRSRTVWWGALALALAVGVAILVAPSVMTTPSAPLPTTVTPAPSSSGVALGTPDPSAVPASAPLDDRPPSVVVPASALAASPSSAIPIAIPIATPIATAAQPAAYRAPHNGERPAAPPADPAPPAEPAVLASASAVAAPPSPPALPAATTPSPVASSPPAPPPASPSFNAETARVEVAQVKSNNAAATGNSVTRALGPFATRFTACFRTALAQSGGPSDETLATLHLESDEQGYVTVARVSGPVLPGAARCIEALSRDVHIEVDTGTANADVTLRFEPR